MTISRSRQALANRAHICGVVVAGARSVRSKKSTSKGSVSVAAYISQSCRSKPRPKRSMTSLICCLSHSSRTISSVVAGTFDATGRSLQLARRHELTAASVLVLKGLRLDIGEHAFDVRIEVDDLGNGPRIGGGLKVAELGVAERATLHQAIAAAQQIGGRAVIVFDRITEVVHSAGRNPIEEFGIGALARDRLDNLKLHVADIAESHAVVDCCRPSAKPAVLNDDLTKHHEPRRAERRIQMSKSRVQVGHNVADLEQRPGQGAS